MVDRAEELTDKPLEPTTASHITDHNEEHSGTRSLPTHSGRGTQKTKINDPKNLMMKGKRHLAMWWDHQNLDKPHIDATGKRWNFRVWHDVAPGGHAERIFFWDDR